MKIKIGKKRKIKAIKDSYFLEIKIIITEKKMKKRKRKNSNML